MVFSLHAYINNITESSTREYREELTKRATPLINNDVPVIFTSGHFCHLASVDFHFLQRAVNRKIDPYRVFYIRKKSGGFRAITVPNDEIKRSQSWIHNNILKSEFAKSRLSPCSTAYGPTDDHLKNAQKHCMAKWIIKIDLSNFFESISERQVYKVFKSLGYVDDLSLYLTRICTRSLEGTKDIRVKVKIRRWNKTSEYNYRSQYKDGIVLGAIGHLPQGAPSSPMLSNLVMIDVDKKIEEISLESGLVYTRYADDITLSGNELNSNSSSCILKKVRKILSEFGFRVNTQKTKIIKPGSRKIITGLSVDAEKPRIPRIYKDRIRQELYFIKRFGIDEHICVNNYTNAYNYTSRLLGRIMYVQRVEPTLGAKFREKFDAQFPNFDNFLL